MNSKVLKLYGVDIKLMMLLFLFLLLFFFLFEYSLDNETIAVNLASILHG